MDFVTQSTQAQGMYLGKLPEKSRPIWHPSAAASRSYALGGRGHDIWLIDGHRNRILRHWHGKELLRFVHTKPNILNNRWTETTWRRIVWSENGTKLLLVCPVGSIAIGFGPCAATQTPPN